MFFQEVSNSINYLITGWVTIIFEECIDIGDIANVTSVTKLPHKFGERF